MLGRFNDALRTSFAVSRARGSFLPRVQVRYKAELFPIPPSFQSRRSTISQRKRQQPKQQPHNAAKRDIVFPDGSTITRTAPTTYHSLESSKLLQYVRSPTASIPPIHPTPSRESPEEVIESTPTDHGLTLNHDVEAFIQRELPDRLALSTQQHLDQHPDLRLSEFYPSIPAYIYREAIESRPIRSLWQALGEILPSDPLNADITSAQGGLEFLQLASPEYQNSLALGWHTLQFNHNIRPSQLLPDGTDRRFLPGPGNIWSHRLWAGGSITLHKKIPPIMDSSDRVWHMVEQPVAIRLDGQEPDKVFITVRKNLFSLERMLNNDNYNKVSAMRVLSQSFQDQQIYGPELSEEYTLCFLRQKPNLIDPPAVRKVLRPPNNSKLTHTFIPSRHLLLAWSALTSNAHLIHLDPQFTREEYGGRNLLVHGPLATFLILEWFRRAITPHVQSRQHFFHLESINYKNLLPLFVDEPMTLAAKPRQFEDPGTVAPVWDVWIEKLAENGDKLMAFKGQIRVSAELDQEAVAKQKPSSAPSMLTNKAYKDADDGSPFKSPFFS